MNIKAFFGFPLFLSGLAVLLVGAHSLLAAAGYPAIQGFGLSVSLNLAGPTYVRSLTTGFYGGVFAWLGAAMVIGSAMLLDSKGRG